MCGMWFACLQVQGNMKFYGQRRLSSAVGVGAFFMGMKNTPCLRLSVVKF